MSQLFTPITLRNFTLDNRIVVPLLCQYSSDDGIALDWHAQHLPALAISGAGLVVVEMTNVEPIGRITPWCARLWNDATRWVARAGFDSCGMHGAHGYLLSSFFSPLSNQRENESSGSIENRMRFPVEVFRAMREAWPVDKPLGVRLSCVDWVDGIP